MSATRMGFHCFVQFRVVAVETAQGRSIFCNSPPDIVNEAHAWYKEWNTEGIEFSECV